MYDHIGLKVKDLAASRRFYEAALAPLGHVLGSHDDSYAGIGPADAPALWLYAAKGCEGAGHAPRIPRCRSPGRRRLSQGGPEGRRHRQRRCRSTRADYSPTYYAAFLIDPDGNNVEAVCP
jgi:catechol 2,3-dioxygenase-like lactoylglutathione lyase family enzyme